MAIINPFQYGGVVGPDAFCNRQQEQSDLTRAIENGDRLFVYAERRMGKTSLVKLVLSQLDPKKYVAVYIDLWPTDGTDSFIRATAKAIAEATATTTDRLLEAAKEFFSLLRPTITLDDSGYPKIQFEARLGEMRIPALDEVLAAPPKVVKKKKRRVVMIFDEFQQILQFEDNQVERSLRSAAQHHEKIAYLFLGSRKHLMEQVFVDARHPLYSGLPWKWKQRRRGMRAAIRRI